jgi:hypothetical protein
MTESRFLPDFQKPALVVRRPIQIRHSFRETNTRLLRGFFLTLCPVPCAHFDQHRGHVTLIFRILVAAMMAFAAFASFQAGEGTGKYLAPAIVLAAAACFWFLELRPTRGSALYAFQHLLLRSLSALLVVGFGITLICFGISELASPLVFNRPLPEAVAGVVRGVFGPIGVTAVLGVAGVAAIVGGLRLLPFRMGRSARE